MTQKRSTESTQIGWRILGKTKSSALATYQPSFVFPPIFWMKVRPGFVSTRGAHIRAQLSPRSGVLITIRTSFPTQPRVVANAQSVIGCDTLRPVDELRPHHPASNDRRRYEVQFRPDARRRYRQYAMPRSVPSERYPARYVIAGQGHCSFCDPNRFQSRFTQHAFVTAVPVEPTQPLKVAINGRTRMKMTLIAVAAVLVTGSATDASAQVAPLSGSYQCVQNCRGPGLAFVAQNGWGLNLVNEVGEPSRAWIDYWGHLWAQYWNEGAIYSPDGLAIQFDDGAVWHRFIPPPPPPVLRSRG